MLDDCELYSAKNVGNKLGLSARTIKDWARDGKFPKPYISKGRFVRWHWTQLDKWVKGEGQENETA